MSAVSIIAGVWQLLMSDGALCVIMTIVTSIWTVMMMDGQVL